MRNPGVSLVIRIALERAESLPLADRALLYRGLAEICGSESAEASLLNAAASFEAAAVKIDGAIQELFPTPTYRVENLPTPTPDQTAKMAV